MTGLWGLLAAAALVWPDRVAGPLDGLPLDRTLEAIAIGVVFPALWWLHPRFLATRAARGLVGALIVWKALAPIAFKPEGWCLRFEPSVPYVKDQTGAPHAWDVRADWRRPDPACSAIVTRSYDSFAEFPAWFFNLPPPNDSWPGPSDRPPGATTRMQVHGFIASRGSGALRIEIGDEMTATLSVDGGAAVAEANLEPGAHLVTIDAMLKGDRWRFNPTWNGRGLWSSQSGPVTTIARTPAWDPAVRPWGRLIPTALAGSLLVAWIISAVASAGDRPAIAWSAAASLALAALVMSDCVGAARWGIAALAMSAAMPIGDRHSDRRTAFVLIGVPWLAFVVASAAPAIGRFVLYDWGHDYWMFQRFAYRIVMQGYWLEGGSPTFWFQPLYRWIVGLLHLVFGDSSAGEWFWDGACLLAGALFSFEIARAAAGFRWGLVAAVAPLAVFVLGTPQYLIGRGLGEITSTGLVSVAALFAMRSRSGDARAAWLAGLFAVLAFYARLNNLLMAAGVAFFTIRFTSITTTAWRQAAIVLSAIAAGVLLFAWRTWHYTGVFSVFYGTQRDLLAIWQPGLSIGAVIARAAASVAMVLTVNDRPRFDWFALPVLAGAAVAVGAIARVPRLRELPLAPVLFFFAAIAGAFIARGSAYPGRFSLHVIPIASALAVSGCAHLAGRAHTSDA